MTAIELFRGGDVLVRARLLPGDGPCVVAFDHHGEDASLDRIAFAERFLDARGLSWVAVLERGNHWYQRAEMPAALAAIRAALGERTGAGRAAVMTYGSSMGGYAALRFADAVGATACLALSPQYSVHRDTVPFEQRWAQEAAAIRWSAADEPPIRCGCVPVVVHDAAGADARHAALIAADTAITGLPLRHAGHPVGTALLAAGLLEPLVAETLNGSLDPAAFLRRWRAERPRNPVYLAELGAAQPDRRLATGIALARRALAIEPGGTLALCMLAELLGRDGRHEEALALSGQAVRLAPDDPQIAHAHGRALDAAGHSEEALALARRLLADRPGRAHLHGWLAMLHWSRRERVEAIRSAEAAAALAPGDRHLADALAWYRHRSHPAVRLRRRLATWRRGLFGAAANND